MRNEGLSSVMPFTNRGLVDKVIRDEAIVYDVWRLTVPVGEGRDERLEKAVNAIGDLKFQKAETKIFLPGVMLQGYPLRNLEDSKDKTPEDPSVDAGLHLGFFIGITSMNESRMRLDKVTIDVRILKSSEQIITSDETEFIKFSHIQ